MSKLKNQIKTLLYDITAFTREASQLTLRQYQIDVALAIAASVINNLGLSFVVMFPRQSGKNELQAQIETYLLTLYMLHHAEIIKISPTWKPQSLNAMRRLERTLAKNILIKDSWNKEQGYIYRVGAARIFFMSGQPEANIVGATASTLLEVDEAQDVQIAKFDKDIAPMAASTNATRVFWGTAWTSNTLLARELRAAQSAQSQDGRQRVFVLDADQVAAEVPAYGLFVAEQVRKLGRSHPMIKTQYYSEVIDAQGGLFPPGRLALIQGTHPPTLTPQSGKIYAFLIDVAGEDEALNALESTGALSNPARDATALTIVEVDPITLEDEIIRAPTYRATSRRLWVGIKHTALYAELRGLIDLWNPRHIIIDATGVGAGLSSFLEKAYPSRVTPFTFNSATKSRLGWDFLAVVDSGRWKEYSAEIPPGSLFQPASPQAQTSQAAPANGSPELTALQQTFYQQLAAVQYEIIPGPDKRMKWSVPDGTRDPQTGELIHDDLVLSAALSALLDDIHLIPTAEALIISAPDPLEQLDHGF